MIDSNAIDRVIGSTAYDRDGDRLGRVGQIYVDSTSGRPMWASVHTGLFGLDESLVPLDDASWDGDELRVPYEKNLVKDAPRIDSHREIEAHEQQELWRYYGLTETGSHLDGHGWDDARVERGRLGGDSVGDESAGRGSIFDELMAGDRRESDLSGSDRDRQERDRHEHDRIGREPIDRDDTRREDSGRATVRKYVAAENDYVDHESGRLDRDPAAHTSVTDEARTTSSNEANPDVVVRVVVNQDASGDTNATSSSERVRIEIDTVGENRPGSSDAAQKNTEFDNE
jgi:hypothetical protein